MGVTQSKAIQINAIWMGAGRAVMGLQSSHFISSDSYVWWIANNELEF